MTTLAVFAGEYAADGVSLGIESKLRCLKVVDVLAVEPDAKILLGAGLGNGRPHLAVLMFEFLVRSIGVDRKQVILCTPLAENTSTEIEAFEDYLRKFPDDLVIAISSWYHIPRIVTAWLLKYGRPVAPVFAGADNHGVLKRACLEPFKMALMLMPISNEHRFAINRWFRQRNII